MTNKKRYLITVPNEQTWKFDRPVIFLGEWCCRYNRKTKWQNMDAIVARPYGINLSKKNKDYSEALKIEENIFPDLCNLLNEEHGKKFSERFWRLVIGHWLKFFIRDLIKDINTIKTCFEEYEISGITTYDCDKYQITPYNFKEAIYSYDYETWKKNVLYLKIIKLLNKENFPVEIIQREKLETKLPYGQKTFTEENKSYKKKFLKFAYYAYSNIARKFIKENDAYIINTFLTLKEEFKLELSLGQFPQLWRFQKNKFLINNFNQKTPDKNKRDNLSRLLKKNDDLVLENIIRNLVFELLPINYLEDFSHMINLANQQSWPKSPKFIYTSNNFYLDDIFKVWSALKVENGNKLFIGQHGNNYGTVKYKFPRIEELYSDKFITWGWNGTLPNYVSGFIFKNSGKNKLYVKPNGGLLLIEEGYTKTDCTFDKKFEYLRYLESQKQFVSHLNKNLRGQLTIRLFNENNQNNDEWSESSRWNDFDPNLKIDNGKEDIKKLIANNRLIVHSYDSTGMLETLSQNLPTLAFWQNGFDHLIDEAKPYYKLLFDVGIIQFSPKLTAEKINEVWDEIDDWWNQANLQNARKLFCERYAKNSRNPSYDLKQILLS